MTLCYFCDEPSDDPEYERICKECRLDFQSRLKYTGDVNEFVKNMTNAVIEFGDNLPKRWAKKRIKK